LALRETHDGLSLMAAEFVGFGSQIRLQFVIFESKFPDRFDSG